MLLWLEEAAIEIGMVLATATGLVMLVAAVWYHVDEHLHQRSDRRARATAQPARPAIITTAAPHTPSGHHA